MALFRTLVQLFLFLFRLHRALFFQSFILLFFLLFGFLFLCFFMFFSLFFFLFFSFFMLLLFLVQLFFLFLFFSLLDVFSRGFVFLHCRRHHGFVLVLRLIFFASSMSGPRRFFGKRRCRNDKAQGKNSSNQGFHVILL
ncbi:MAG: hypothetical protein DRH04_06270 [Deltaproteobacteria bacterium]|nr:MAG: hypothetical protein DRH04_06270 [Deltaproteobacteria bacterium]